MLAKRGETCPFVEAVPLWEGVAPGSEGWTWEERSLKLAAPSTEYVFLLNVVQPTLTPVLPDPAAATGAAVVVCPGGGYAMLAIAHEGFDVAQWLAERGIAAFVLKYRVMETPEGDDMSCADAAADPSGLAALLRRMDEFAAIPLADGIAALGHVRARAAEWGVQADRVGAVGFSAGARLVLDLATHDNRDVRPAFAGSHLRARSRLDRSRRRPAALRRRRRRRSPLRRVGPGPRRVASGRASGRGPPLRSRRPRVRHDASRASRPTSGSTSSTRG